MALAPQLRGGGHGGWHRDRHPERRRCSHHAQRCCLLQSGELLVDRIAKRQGVINAGNTFYSVKRFVVRQASEIEE